MIVRHYTPVCNDGKKLIQITTDHKPNDPIEKNRIYKAGGSILEQQIIALKKVKK